MHKNFDWRNYHPSPLLKAIQFFLLFLIFIGVCLLITQKLWVPKLVEYILKTETITVVPVTSETPLPNPSLDTNHVYATYMCDAGKTIQADFLNGESKPASGPDQPPIPGGSVDIILNDGPRVTLAQTISADGSRYANADESFVFWSKGNGALILENGKGKNYTGCIQVSKDPGGLPKVYQNSKLRFSLRYPEGYSVDEKYVYQELGPGKDITGVRFTIPASITKGTNLGTDSYVGVEEMADVSNDSCKAELFLPQNGKRATTIDDNGITYSFSSYIGAGAGNRYEESVFVLPNSNPCIAVRYFIHYGAIENYDPGTIKAFDRVKLLADFDMIRKTLVVN